MKSHCHSSVARSKGTLTPKYSYVAVANEIVRLCSLMFSLNRSHSFHHQ